MCNSSLSELVPGRTWCRHGRCDSNCVAIGFLYSRGIYAIAIAFEKKPSFFVASLVRVTPEENVFWHYSNG